MPRLLNYLFASSLFLLFLCTHVAAQSSSATLSGTVEDQNGAAIPAVAVSVENVGTRIKREAVTNASGYFTVPLLPPGEYTVMARANGFAAVQIPAVILNVGDQKSLQIGMKIGDVNAQIEVRPDETLINTSPSVATTIDRNFAQNLPLNGRSFQSLILITPGVTVVPAGVNSPGQFSVNGQRSNANYFTVDGVSANTGVTSGAASGNAGGLGNLLAGNTPGSTSFGGTNGLVSVDALEEFKIQTSTYSAEFGRQPGGQISLVTRSGKNKFEGNLFEYFRNEKLDANDWFANAGGRERVPLRQNIFGGTFSGPIIFPNFGDEGSRWYDGKNRTFFFFSYEGIRLLLPQAVNTSVPSLRLRNEVASAAIKKLLDAFPLPTGSEVIATCTVGASDPQCVATPDPTDPPTAGRKPSGFSSFTGVYSDPSTADIAGIRIDHRLNDQVTIFGRYNYANSNSQTRATSRSLSMVDESQVKTKTLTLGSTWALGSSISNEIRFNMTDDSPLSSSFLDDFGQGVPVEMSDLVPDLSVASTINANVSFSLSGTTRSFILGLNQANGKQRQLNIVDNVTWIKGAHIFRFGIDYRRLLPVFAPVDYFQGLTFNSETGIRNGTVASVSILARKSSRPVFENFSIYGQDTWKALRRLTVDFGLRWELNPPPGGDADQLVTLVGADHLPTATVAPPGTPMYETDFAAVAPRVGIAYQLSDRKGLETVVRGGFGIYYDTGNASAGNTVAGFPFVVSRFLSNQPFPLSPTIAIPPPFSNTVTPTTSLTAFVSGFRLPYTLQWNASIEQSLGADQTFSASYVAASGRRLTARHLRNTSLGGFPLQNTTFGSVNLISNGATSDYHSLQLQFRRRLSRGIQALVNYTWAHAIDTASDESSVSFDRGDASFDVRHNFSAAATYNLPGSKLKGAVGAILRDWSFDGIVHAQSGSPVNLVAGTFVREDGTQGSVRPDLVSGQPLYIKDAGVAGGRRFNSLAFTPPPRSSPTGPFLRQGTLGRNVLRTLPLYQVDIALRRRFDLTERINVQIKGEAFNVFNHPNFGAYEPSINSLMTFGTPTTMLGRSLGGLNALYQIGGPRSIQLSVRLGF